MKQKYIPFLVSRCNFMRMFTISCRVYEEGRGFLAKMIFWTMIRNIRLYQHHQRLTEMKSLPWKMQR